MLSTRPSPFKSPAGLNGDGRVDNIDLYALPTFYGGVGAAAVTVTEGRNAVLRRGDVTTNFTQPANAADIDALYQNLGNANWNYDFDASGGAATRGDVDTLVHTILHSEYGDATLDGIVNTTDFNILAANFGRTSGAGWATADFSGDLHVDTTDFNLLAAHFGFTYSESAAAASLGVFVPEPSVAVALAAMVFLLRNRREVAGMQNPERRLRWGV